ncbi:ABC transporter substrate-binding protein [Oceanobacter sp. 3_MG-2023]|uniref:ABC transporter substrate-binding protein n=1 Tax=Oceanobacter sp. 3_MG-2023 TaxID=3062622 RepID=UPI0027370A65|nr:ABC transporter substrate-binding protein [Oceanobacter sp. 3_MG-2023]MDP2504326.1 ABC transporter substrate-binding protein [Oceanobacter sp. 3_MG-2023]
MSDHLHNALRQPVQRHPEGYLRNGLTHRRALSALGWQYWRCLLIPAVMALLSLQANAIIPVTYTAAPEQLTWQAPDITAWGDPAAEPGGVFRLSIAAKPTTLRRFGPQTPNQLSPLLADLQLPLLARHPDNGSPVPMLAARWAVADHRITYQLHDAARWSDGIPITSQDIAFTLQFLSDPANQTPWQAQSLSHFIRGIEVHDTQRFSLITTTPVTSQSLLQISALKAMAQHFYQPNLQWPRQYDWRPEPTSGPYHLTEVIPSERLLVSRIRPWWGDNLPAFGHRFNAQQIRIRFSKNLQDSYLQLQRGDQDILPLHNQKNWNSPLITQLLGQRPVARYRHYFQGNPSLTALLINHQQLQPASRKPGLTLIHAGVTNNSPLLQQQQEAFKNQGYQIQRQALDHDALLERLKTGNFELAWITLDGLESADASDYLAWLTQHYPAAHHIEVKQDQTQPQASQYLAWQWVKLPSWLGMRYSNDLFNPFAATTGGMFWIDQRLKTNALARTAKFSTNQTFINDTYQTDPDIGLGDDTVSAIRPFQPARLNE